MGDRCAMCLTFREENRRAVEEVLGPGDMEEAHPDLPGCVVVDYSEVNYGASDDRGGLAGRGVTFLGHHYAGSDYGPLAFAACGGQMDEIDADHLGWPVVRIDNTTGQPTEDGRRAASEYVQRLRLVREDLRQRAGLPSQEPPPESEVQGAPMRRLVVEVRGGLVQAVYGDPDISVAIVDWDTEAEEPVVVHGEDVLGLAQMPEGTRKALEVAQI